MKYSWLRIGVECTLVTEFNESLKYSFETFPKRNIVYTVRDIIYEDGPNIHLNEIKNPLYVYDDQYEEVYFPVKCFSPVVRKTEEQDMELFKSIAALAHLRKNHYMRELNE